MRHAQSLPEMCFVPLAKNGHGKEDISLRAEPHSQNSPGRDDRAQIPQDVESGCNSAALAGMGELIHKDGPCGERERFRT